MGYALLGFKLVQFPIVRSLHPLTDTVDWAALNVVQFAIVPDELEVPEEFVEGAVIATEQPRLHSGQVTRVLDNQGVVIELQFLPVDWVQKVPRIRVSRKRVHKYGSGLYLVFGEAGHNDFVLN